MRRFLLCFGLLLGTISMMFAGEITFDFKNQDYGLVREATGYTKTGTIEESPVSIALATPSGNGFRLWSDGLRVYKGEATMTFTIPEGYKITKITYNWNKTSPTSFSPTSTTNEAYVWTGDESSVVATIKPSANNAIDNIVIEYSEPVTLLPAGMSFPEEEYTAVMGQPFTAPVLTKETDAEVTYSSEDESVATVDPTTGEVTLVAEGETIITAEAPATDKYEAGSAHYLLNVEKAGTPVLLPAGMSFPEAEYTANMVDAFTAPALTKETNAPVTYTSSDEAVATVNAEGAVTILSAGVTTITATAEANDTYQAGSASYTLNVVLLPAGLSFAEAEYTANLGEEFAAPALAKATDASISYTSSNEAVATVDAEGAITLVGAGETTITATAAANEKYEEGAASYKLTVVDPNAPLDVTFDFVNEAYGLERNNNNAYVTSGTKITEAPVTITLNGTNGVRLWSDGLRAYKTGSLLVSVDNAYLITKIVVTTKSSTKLSFDGTTETTASTTHTWTGSADEVSIGFTHTSGNIPVTSIEIECTPVGDPNKDNVELSFPEAVYTAVYPGEFTAPELTKSAEVEITYSSSNTDVATVDAQTGAVTLTGAGTTTIKATSAETDTYNAGMAFYELNVELGANSIKDIIDAGQNVDIIVNFPMTITYINGRYIYVYDGENYGLVYDNNAGDPTYAEGAVIPAGWKVNYVDYNGLPEIQPLGAMPASTETAQAPALETVARISDDMVNQIVVLQGVEFKSATLSDTSDNFTGTVNGTEYTFRNNFKISAVDAGTYNVKLAVGYFKTDVQLVPIEYVKVETYTVYLNNAAGWDEVYVYAWQDTDNETLLPCGAWPGTKLEANADGLYEFSITAETEPIFSGIIFNNGGNGEQTPDLTYVAGKTYTNETAISFVYFDNKAYWADVHVYAWNKTTGKNNAGWPGEAAQKCKIGDNDYYYFAAPAGTYDMIIFNGSGAQTTDLSLIDGTIYSTDNQGENATSQEKMNDLGQVSLELPFTSEKTEEDLIVTFQVPASFHIYYTFTPTTETVPENAPARAKADYVAAEKNVVTLPKDVTGKLDYYAEVNNTETAPSTYNIDASGEITGVDNIAISAEQTTVYYYNMQGVRIANPANGMYIRVEGNKVSKVIVK